MAVMFLEEPADDDGEVSPASSHVHRSWTPGSFSVGSSAETTYAPRATSATSASTAFIFRLIYDVLSFKQAETFSASV